MPRRRDIVPPGHHRRAVCPGNLLAVRSTTMDIDARGPRFAAVITTVVLALALATTSMWLLLAQMLVFAVGAIAGMRYAPYGLVYRFLIRPRLGPPTRFQAAAPSRGGSPASCSRRAGDHPPASSRPRPRGSLRRWGRSSPRSA